jgi:hypothetical protein
MKFSRSTGGFYLPAIHGDNIPADAVEITEIYHAELLAAQSAGKRIQPDATGYPVAVAPESLLTLDELKANRVAALSADCQAQIYGGFTSDALGAPHLYPAKDRDQANLSGSVVASLLPGLAAGWVTPFWCMDAAGNWAFKPHTVAQIQQVGADGKAAIVAALERNAILAAQVMDPATDTAEKVAAIVWWTKPL